MSRLGSGDLNLPFEPSSGTADMSDAQLSGGLVVMAATMPVEGLGVFPVLIFRFTLPDGTFLSPIMLVVEPEEALAAARLVVSAATSAVAAATPWRVGDLPAEGDLVRLYLKGRLQQRLDALVILRMPDGTEVHLHPRLIEQAETAEDIQPGDVHSAADGVAYAYTDPRAAKPWIRLGPDPERRSNNWWLRDGDVPRPLKLLIRDGQPVTHTSPDAPPDSATQAAATPAPVDSSPGRPVPGPHLMGHRQGVSYA